MTRANRSTEPYRQVLAGIIPREYDRRVKYTEEQREEVRRMHKVYGLAQREIERRTGISRRMISFILFPERLAVVKAQYKERRKDGRYYPPKEKWRETMRKHRHYKKELHNKGII